MKGVFEIFKGKDGQHYFRFKLNEGQKIIRSEGYTTKSAAKKRIMAVKRISKLRDSYLRKKTKDNKYYFNIKAKNGEIVSTSKTYSSKIGREGAIYTIIQTCKNCKSL